MLAPKQTMGLAECQPIRFGGPDGQVLDWRDKRVGLERQLKAVDRANFVIQSGSLIFTAVDGLATQ